MHKLGFIILLFAWPSIGWAEEQILVDKAKLAACLMAEIGKERLSCYREISGQAPSQRRIFSKAAIDRCLNNSTGMEELACFDKLFQYPRPGSPE